MNLYSYTLLSQWRQNILEYQDPQERPRLTLLFNLATRCGYTGQLEHMEALYRTHNQKAPNSLLIVGVASDTFSQCPGTLAEITTYCATHYDVTFPIVGPVDLAADPLFCDIARRSQQGAVKWNFEKFLFDHAGRLINRYPTADTEQYTRAIDQYLGRPRLR